MECALCHSEIKDNEKFSLCGKFYFCEKCVEHINNGGKFVRIDNLSRNVDSFGDKLKSTLGKWINYKAQIGDTYTERGKQTLITQIKNQVKATSEEVVIAKINNSIEHKWKGICWEDNSFLKPQIIDLFEKTWEMVVNTESKEEAKRYYLYLFKTYSNIDKIKVKARQIYIAYKRYSENLSNEKYCKTFYNFLKAEVPTE